jgi:hypothetical protein
MIIKSMIIKYGMFEKKFTFDEKIQVFTSHKNSSGKTTLIRFLLYGLGFNIPNTRSIKMEKYDVITNIINDDVKEIEVFRSNISAYLKYDSTNENHFLIPHETSEMHKLIFNIDNILILESLLGVIYFDQEKGWTMLNRGTIIGRNSFKIEEYIRGLSNIDASEVIKKIDYLEDLKTKYSKLLDIAEYQEEIAKSTGNISYESYEKKIVKEINIVKSEISALESDIKSLKKSINDNTSFRKYIEKMRLYVLYKDERIPVNEDTIDGLPEFKQIQEKRLDLKYRTLKKLYSTLDDKQKQYEKQYGLLQVEDKIIDYENRILGSRIDTMELYRIVDNVKDRLRDAKSELKELNESNIQLMHKINNYVLFAMDHFGITDSIHVNQDTYLLTKDLKSLSGTLLHFTVAAFKYAYIKILQETYDINVPIVIDSPGGKEVKDENVEKLLNFYINEFPKNQIIISTMVNLESLEEVNIEYVPYKFLDNLSITVNE